MPRRLHLACQPVQSQYSFAVESIYQQAATCNEHTPAVPGRTRVHLVGPEIPAGDGFLLLCPKCIPAYAFITEY